MVDAYSETFVGVSFRDEENHTAGIEAVDDGVSTTGAPPLATLLDNRPSNHTPEVEGARQTLLTQQDPVALLTAMRDHVTVGERQIDRLFWLTAVVSTVNGQPHDKNAPMVVIDNRRYGILVPSRLRHFLPLTHVT